MGCNCIAYLHRGALLYFSFYTLHFTVSESERAYNKLTDKKNITGHKVDFVVLLCFTLKVNWLENWTLKTWSIFGSRKARHWLMWPKIAGDTPGEGWREFKDNKLEAAWELLFALSMQAVNSFLLDLPYLLHFLYLSFQASAAWWGGWDSGSL